MFKIVKKMTAFNSSKFDIYFRFLKAGSQSYFRMSANVSPGPLLSKPPLRVKEGSLVVQWLSLVSGLQISAFLVDILALPMCIASTAVVNWRVWRVENIKGTGSGNIWIGIWQVCFLKDPSNDGNYYYHCEELHEQHPSLPREIFIAQDLMELAAIMNSSALGLISFALYNVFKPRKHKDFLLTFFGLGALLNLVAGILVLISVIWNMSAVLQNGEIDFPETFELPQIPSEQHIGPSIYLGYIAAGFQLLSAALVGIERCCIRTTAIESLTTCTKCGSLLDLSSAVEMEESCASDLVIPEKSCVVELEESRTPQRSPEGHQSQPEVPKHTIIYVIRFNRKD
ncbi:claudin-34-like isoform X3 [Podarcis raffonei]|uniref:claudin-34-like isoform X3 n=1 Tax=Podarcis raffonei TaxID=65483 RepID=UPI002329260B|nr:claudin-34-like isoform X3 [Podarcis raffonei]